MRPIRLFSSSTFRPSLLVILCATALLGGSPRATHAQAPAAAPQGSAAQALSQQGDALFDQRNYKAAAQVYENLLKGYPNSEYALDAQFHLAYANFLTGQFDPAAEGLRKLMTQPNAAPESLEQAALLLPQVLAQKAGGLKPEDTAGRTAGFEAAIKEYDTFVQKYPKSASLESVLYGRAVCAYQIGRFEAAEKDLRAGVTNFPNSESLPDTKFLLSITVATRANLALAKENKSPAEAAAALKGYQESETLLAGIANQRQDISLANDAQLQLGDTLLAHAASATEADRNRLYAEALKAFRAVEPKAPMLAAQAGRVQAAVNERIAELRKGAAANRNLTRQLDSRRLREQGKLEALQAKEDPVVMARLKAGSVFFNLKGFDEARVLMEALLPATGQKAEEEKIALRYITLTYIEQKLYDKAVAAYDKFQAKYKGDPDAEGLPFAMALLFQSGEGADPAKAEKYLADFSKLYPNSKFRETALLSQAESSAGQGRYDDALKTIDQFIKSNPKRELLAAGELARARYLKEKRDLDGALAAYKTVRDKYKGLPEAEDASFWVGVVNNQKKDLAGAVTELQGFLKNFPDSKRQPTARYTLATAQQAANTKDQAVATLTELADKFPDSPEAQSGYFLRSNIFLSDKKFDEVTKVLTAFVDKYPESDQKFAAFNTIASIQAQGSKFEEATATYEAFIAKQPATDLQVGEALSKEAALWLRAARGMGTYIILGAPQKEEWSRYVNNSITASERQLQGFPEAPATALGLQNLLECQKMLVGAKVKTDETVRQYFEGLADKYKDSPGARTRILFRLAALTAEKDPARALADMKAAYNPEVVYSPADLDLYSRGLLASDPATAQAVFDKLAKDYPLPAGATPAQATPDVQEAQALALFGRAKLAETKDKAQAAPLYAQLVKDYPRSSKVSEARLGVAEGLVASGKGAEALPLLADVMKLPATPLAARARAMFLNGQIQEAKGEEGAMDSYLKVAVFYPTSAEAAEGLWKGAQLLEKQAATLGETPAKPGGPTKTGQLAKARKAYQDLVAKYGESQWAAQAKARVAALPAQAAK